jgi:hypothetical protein
MGHDLACGPEFWRHGEQRSGETESVTSRKAVWRGNSAAHQIAWAIQQRKCSYPGVSPISFVSDAFLTELQPMQHVNGPTVFTFLSHIGARHSHAVSRLPDDDADARRPDAATHLPDATDCLTPSLSAFLPHGLARPCPSFFFPRRDTRSPSYLASMAARWI